MDGLKHYNGISLGRLSSYALLFHFEHPSTFSFTSNLTCFSLWSHRYSALQSIVFIIISRATLSILFPNNRHQIIGIGILLQSPVGPFKSFIIFHTIEKEISWQVSIDLRMIHKNEQFRKFRMIRLHAKC